MKFKASDRWHKCFITDVEHVALRLDVNSLGCWNLGLYKYEGGIKWDGPNPSGTCSPVACLGDGLNGVPGPECKCANGFAGEPMYTPPESQNLYWKPGFNGRTCVPAQCNISNSIGRGIACKCKDKFVGTISWQGAVAHGECTPALCNVTNSNKKPGPECDCLNGHSGHLYMGSGNKIEGRCSALPCKGRFSNQKSGPDCACADGYNGTVRKEMYDWDDNIWAYTESPHMLADPCLPAACDVDGSTGDPGLECHCRDGFRGEIIWEGPRAEGSCRPAPCSVVNSNRESGTDCRCLDGYDGSNLDFHVVAATSFLFDHVGSYVLSMTVRETKVVSSTPEGHQRKVQKYTQKYHFSVCCW